MNDFAYGTIGGMVGTICSHPFDTVKSRLQTQNHKSIWSCVRHTHAENGLKAFYRGLAPPLIGCGAENAIVFGTYNLMKRHTDSDFISGLVAGAACCVVVTPIEHLKINKQVKSGTNFYSQFNFKNIKLSTVRLMYKGIGPTLCRETPGFGIYFSVYEYLKSCYDMQHPVQTFIYGGIAGTSSWVFIYPPDVVKTNLQLTSNNYKSMRDCATDLYRKYGIRYFYKGFSTAMARAFPFHGGAFLGYELSKQFFEEL